jgi:hypothetical protein
MPRWAPTAIALGDAVAIGIGMAAVALRGSIRTRCPFALSTHN